MFPVLGDVECPLFAVEQSYPPRKAAPPKEIILLKISFIDIQGNYDRISTKFPEICLKLG